MYIQVQISPICGVFPMDLEHIEDNFTDRSTFELSTVFLRGLTALKSTHTGQSWRIRKTKLNVFFWDGEAHGVFLVSVCSPVNCIAWPWFRHKHYHCEQMWESGCYRRSFLLLTAEEGCWRPGGSSHDISAQTDEWQLLFHKLLILRLIELL